MGRQPGPADESSETRTIHERRGEHAVRPAPRLPLEEIEALEETLRALQEDSHERIEGCLEGVTDEHETTRVEAGAHAEGLQRSIDAAQCQLLDEMQTLREEIRQELDSHRQAVDERLAALEGSTWNGEGETQHETAGPRST